MQPVNCDFLAFVYLRNLLIKHNGIKEMNKFQMCLLDMYISYLFGISDLSENCPVQNNYNNISL